MGVMGIEHRAVDVFEIASLAGILAVVIAGVFRQRCPGESGVPLDPSLCTPRHLAFRRCLETSNRPRINLTDDGVIALRSVASPRDPALIPLDLQTSAMLA